MERVLERMEETDSAQILPLPYDHEDVLAIVERADLVISSRMHLLILAALVSTPIVGISRVPKVDAMLEHYELSAAASTTDLDFKRFRERLDRDWGEREAIRERLTSQRESLAERARSNARIFRGIVD